MSKKWIIVFFSVAALIVVMLGTLNYVADPFEYWAIQQGKIDNLSTYRRTNLGRHIKAYYIKRNPQKYSAVIFGGSNAGAINPELMTQLTGNNSYNCYTYWGDLSDHLYSTKYCIKTMPNLKEIFILISNGEMNAHEKTITGSDSPAIVSGKSLFMEKLSFIVFNPFESFKPIITDRMPIEHGILYVAKENKNPLHEYGDTIDGRMEVFYQNLSDEDLPHFIETHVLGKNIPNNFDIFLEKLFTETEKDFSTGNLAIENLRKIKELCDKNNIKLTVVIRPSFVSSKASFEGEQYYSWIRELALITPVWDFGGFCEANLNPYNFNDSGHFNYFTADEMLRIIYGEKENPDFGILLTPLNIEQYIIDRRQKFAELKDEYLETGTVHLEDKEKSFRFRPTE